jgi:hypothetical protein
MRVARKLFRKFLWGVIALILLFEEWGWEPLAALLARLVHLAPLVWLERMIARLPPHAALLAFGLPMIVLLPAKLLALYLFSVGQVALGIVFLVAAKVIGTAILAWLFQITRPALMKLPWFAHWYPRWKAWKDRLIQRVRRSPLWIAAHRMKLRLKAWRTKFRQRFR